MTANAKLRIGDAVYHRNLDLGPGKVRYIFRGFVTVSFEKAPVQRYSKDEICKDLSRPSEPASNVSDVSDKHTKLMPKAA